MQNKEKIHRARKNWVDLVIVAHLEHHVQEVFTVRQRVIGVNKGETHAKAVCHCGQCGNLGNETQRLAIERLFIEHVFCIRIKSAKSCDRRNEHAHGVCVVVETINETLTHVFVNEGVMGDIEGPLV